MNTEPKAYLGDAVYADYVYGTLVLTTEDGFQATNTVDLEPVVVDALLAYIKRMRGGDEGGR